MSHLLSLSFLLAAGVAGQALINGPMVIIMGPPGSGKSTQAKLAAQTLKLPILSAEDIIASNRGAFEKMNPPGITGMNPRTDPALNGLFAAAIGSEKYRNGAVVDGYPATKDHVDYLRSMVLDGRLPNPTVVQLDISDEALRKRLGKSADQQFEQLLKDYHRETDMLNVYFPAAKIIHVDADSKPARVNKRIQDAVLPLAPVKTRS